MKFSSVLTSGLASFTLVAGLPTVTTPSEHSVQQVRNPVYKRNGIAALDKIYRKYHINLPEYLKSSVLARRDETSTVTNKPIENNAEWLTPVQIGNPPRTFQMDLDTGSSDLWVYGSKVATAGGSSNRYNASSSKTCEEMAGAKWSIEYGDGSGASGHVVKDTVSIGGLSVEAQAVQVADKVDESFATQQELDGLLGLGFSSINTVTPKKQKTFFDNAKTEHDTGVFTADLKHDAPGTYTFGVINKTAYEGDITYTTVDSSTGMWAFTSTGYAVGKGNVTKTAITAIADTGTSLMFLPEAVNKAYYSQISGAKIDATAGGYVFPCDTKMPDFTFYVGESGITVPGAYMNFAPLEGPVPGEKEGKREVGTCYGGLQSSAGDINIFGDIALKAAFVVFDAEKTRIGFAKKTLAGVE
ncbi:endothiapepsin precursor [Fusarium pseudocircinatum]|uniref:Endothiapepsin n=1 Tax=Fusarium pseudocircinatum TaxID=56676 RepID=A0A8H5KZJ4_9HYPO|nr:endothiapepsin precursor [Fusarium pseudocircinatum]